MKDDPDRKTPSDAPIAPGSGSVLSLDTVLEVLANQRRRFALYTLIDSSEESVALEVIIEDVATLEAAIAGNALTRDCYVTIAADIYHWHVRVLADVGIVEYDERSQTVQYRQQPFVETWVGRLRREELYRQ